HQLLTRENPRRFTPPIPPARKFNGAVDPQLEKILVTCTAVDREQRHDSARTLGRALSAFRESRLQKSAEQLKSELGKLVLSLFTPPEDNEISVAMQRAVVHSQKVKTELSKPVVPTGIRLPWPAAVLLSLALCFAIHKLIVQVLVDADSFSRIGVPIFVALLLMVLQAVAGSENAMKQRLFSAVCYGVPAAVGLMFMVTYPYVPIWWLVTLVFVVLAVRTG
ncbi:MAG: hypothetical protein AB1758_02630, partial [Candidatus Eremiobacterota bacterium]